MPAPEQVAPEPASRSRLQHAAAWSVAALITLAAAISVLLSKTVAGATASATPARATAKPSHHHPGPQPRRAHARAHAHRVMTAHAVQVAARARRTRQGSPSARHSWGCRPSSRWARPSSFTRRSANGRSSRRAPAKAEIGCHARLVLEGPVGRLGAAAVHRARFDRPARGRRLGRAHDRARSRTAPGDVGPDRKRARQRGDDRAGHPLHGGGRAALRQGGAHRPGQGRRPRRAFALAGLAAAATRVRLRAPGQWMLQRGGRRRTSSSSSPSASISASTP